jgi:hypothetical protein
MDIKVNRTVKGMTGHLLLSLWRTSQAPAPVS